MSYKLDEHLNMQSSLDFYTKILEENKLNQDIKIDCSHVTFCGASAAQIFLSLSQSLKSSGHRLILNSASEHLKEDLCMLGLESLLKE